MWAFSGGFSGEAFYWRHSTGELVSVQQFTDVSLGQCGNDTWFGRVIRECEVECQYAEVTPQGGTILPVCGDEPP